MLATNAPHPNCAYKWMQWVTTPKVQAEEADYFGETPANTQACPIMDKIRRVPARRTTPTRREAYFKTIKFWKTPLAQCGNGKNDCVPFQQWVTAWTQIRRLTSLGVDAADRRPSRPAPSGPASARRVSRVALAPRLAARAR